MAEDKRGGAGRSPAAHGIIGNLRTCALVTHEATLDFLCFPRFDSPTVLAGLLDAQHGGQWTLAPVGYETMQVKQLYLPDTNVLVTRFLSEDRVGEVTDLMPLTSSAEDDRNRVVRTVKTVRGRIEWQCECAPRFDYARQAHVAEQVDDNEVQLRPEGDALPMRLRATVPLTVSTDGTVGARFTLDKEQLASFVFAAADEEIESLDGGVCQACVDDTVAYWQRWLEKSAYRGRYREIVSRSALVLKLLTSRDHGAIIASPTFGLPETLEGERRWDYRFVWVRDAAFTLYALLRLGYTDEAAHFMQWMGDRTRHCDYDGQLNLVYTLDGETPPGETELASLSDQHAASPVLVGNEASKQLQLDIYGALLDAVYLYNKYGTASSYDSWQHIVRTVDYVVAHWNEPDHGIWESRDGKAHLLHSRVMCWVTIDRALRLAGKRSLPAPIADWEAARGAIQRDVFDNFWNEELGAFTQTRGGDTLDASALQMPLVRFVAPKDPRWLSTLDAIGRELFDDPLVYRYQSNDGLDGHEGSFMACGFWYVEALARAGQIEKARLTFEKLLGYANHLHLFSEEISPGGIPLGNFPQALTHLALISAAYRLDRILDGAQRPWED
ncbi:glycoside hydrolase family 15 protein [Chitinasiproducens palmae]|uniref:Glucoamylase (Glucan-1,4-alpha-glucosidase), GH15 family n=1 Tax=Chitinasiproducens palmae TaxID=1770053 RepID=A0A1H2PP29_9BURK|nr:glycoside hydrolase family 15 protein [Chitinasiproducens palmae]SDV48443.1 Glucoamylase (glucan-1,4-alpha-glucosidase), GH15 family [Chitinasiproducens palmae]